MRVPTTTTEVKAETSYTLYDYKYRPIRSYTTNYLGGYTYTDSKLDVFSGQLQYTIQKHKRTTGDSELVVKDTFTYTAQDRLIQHTHQINGGAEQLLAENTYDELGKLTSKKVGNTSAAPLQKVDYSYNIRGWMTAINSIANLNVGTDPADLFSFKLNYNTVDGNVNAANKLYNGNIAETFWSTATDGGFVRNYGYKYDNLNRLKDATYQKSGQVTGMYNENLSYDKNGNIMNLSRYGDRDEQYLPIQIDYLQYGYATNSNKLMSVVDNSNNTSGFKDGNTTGDDYVYDANGNMTVDKNKNITSIVYNHLNLPTKIIFPTGNIVYFYNASGQKAQKVVTENTTVTTTDYLGGYQYKNAVLQFFPTVEGYVKNTLVSGTNSYSYVFNYTDHLGNTRLSYAKDTTTGSLKILEENNYYPFGLKHSPYNSIAPLQDYKVKFQGQERQDELGLNWDSFKWRNYDYTIGRFMGVDPLSEKYSYQSHYNFSENRVVDGRELEGLEWENFRTTGANPGSLVQKSPSTDAQKQHYSVTVENSKRTFSEFKSDFQESPQKFLTNSKAVFNSPVDGNGNSSDFQKGSFIKINIDGPMNNAYVKVVGMENKKDKLTTTFGTLEGHMEKGKITFRLQENKDGSIKFSIDSKSEVDMGVAKSTTTIEDFSRKEQMKSWQEVLTNITKYLGGKETKREVSTSEQKK